MRKIDLFDKYMKYKGLNDNKVTVQLGLTVGTIGKSRKIGRDLSQRTIEKILNFYTDINKSWLLTGEGEMLKSEGENIPCTLEYPISGIPIYDIDATCGPIVRDFVGEPIIGYINIPEVKHGAVIVRATGDSMLPAICNNDYVAILEVKDVSTIVWGQIYLVILDEYRLLKYLRKHPDETKLILKSENSSKYDDIIISKSDIVKLYIVENIIALRTLL